MPATPKDSAALRDLAERLRQHVDRLAWTFHRGFRRATSLPLFSIALPETIREIRLSDNSSFWDQGYRALMITDTSFLRNPHYHTATDTPDTLDYHRMALATLGVAGGVARLAGRRGWVGPESS